MEFGSTDSDRDGDRRVVEYLAGEYLAGEDLDGLGDEQRAELDELRALLADPALWAEPRPELEDAVVSAIAAEAERRTPTFGVGTAWSTASAAAAAPHIPGPASWAAGAGAPQSVDQPPAVNQPRAIEQPPSPPIDFATAAARRRSGRPGRSGWRRVLAPVPLISIAAALAAVVVSGLLLFSAGTKAPRFDVALAGTNLAPNAAGSATLTRTDSGWLVVLHATGLPRLDGGQFYQAWLRNSSGVLVPIGTFNEGTDVMLWSGVSPADYPTFTVTKEMADGNQASSGQRVLSGNAVPD